MRKSIDFAELDALQYDLEASVGIVSAIQVAIEYGPHAPSEYYAPLSMACANLQEVVGEIKKVIREDKA